MQISGRCTSIHFWVDKNRERLTVVARGSGGLASTDIDIVYSTCLEPEEFIWDPMVGCKHKCVIIQNMSGKRARDDPGND